MRRESWRKSLVAEVTSKSPEPAVARVLTREESREESSSDTGVGATLRSTTDPRGAAEGGGEAMVAEERRKRIRKLGKEEEEDADGRLCLLER